MEVMMSMKLIKKLTLLALIGASIATTDVAAAARRRRAQGQPAGQPAQQQPVPAPLVAVPVVAPQVPAAPAAPSIALLQANRDAAQAALDAARAGRSWQDRCWDGTKYVARNFFGLAGKAACVGMLAFIARNFYTEGLKAAPYFCAGALILNWASGRIKIQ